MSIISDLVDRVADAGARVMARAFAGAMDRRYGEIEEKERLYHGQQYEGRGLAPSWDQVPAGSRKVPLRQQKPSVQYDLPSLIVDRPTALLFGEGRFPEISFEADAEDTDTTEVTKWLTKICDEGDLQCTALTWSRQGAATGSAVITWGIVDGEFDFRSHSAKYCTPTFHPRARKRLTALELKYKYSVAETKVVDGREIKVEVDYWHREAWTENEHIVYQPAKVDGDKLPTWVEAERAVHNFGFVPAAWVKNRDDGEPGKIDGESLLKGVDRLVEDIDRTVSQKSRAVRYNTDPERIYYGLTDAEKQKLQVGGGASTSLGKKTDGYAVELVELKGEGQKIAEEHAIAQRNRALEMKRIVLPDPDKLLAAGKSGVALRILHAVMIELVGEMRQMYGRAVRSILNQIVDAARAGKLGALGTFKTALPTSIPAGRVALTWGDVFELTPEDLVNLANACATLLQAELMDQETLVRTLASYFGVRDVAAVLERIEKRKNSDYGPMLTRPGQQPVRQPPIDDEDEDDDAEA